MRPPVDQQRVRAFIAQMGRAVRGPGRIYLVGGASAVLLGWREATIDVDLKAEPEPGGLFEAIVDLKQRLDVNVELAAPSDFVPELPGWRERSVFIERSGSVDFFHYDFYAQFLAKAERGHAQDRVDCARMLADGLVDSARMLDLFERVAPALVRYPALSEPAVRERLHAALASKGAS